MGLQLSGKPKLIRRAIKAMLYTPLAVATGLRIPFGKVQPRIEFTVEADPPSVYFNFAVRAERLQDFIDYLELPSNLPLAPIRCIEGEDEAYLLTLNVYRVSGISNGIRAEFSTYITDEEGVPRYMVVEARDHTGSMDPINIFTRASTVEHERDEACMQTVVESDDGATFSASAPQAAFDVAPRVDIDPQWMQANDFIYWRNGIRDRCFYDAGMANPSVRQLDPALLEMQDDTHWAEFLEPVPRHVLVYENAIPFVIVPWENL